MAIERLLYNFNNITEGEIDFLENTAGYCLHSFHTLLGYSYSYENGIYCLKAHSAKERCKAASFLVFGCVISIPMTLIGFIATWYSNSHSNCYEHFVCTTMRLEMNNPPEVELILNYDSTSELSEGLKIYRDNTLQAAAKVTDRYYKELKERNFEDKKEFINANCEPILINIFRNYALSTEQDEPSRSKLKYISKCYFKYFTGIKFDIHGYLEHELHIISNEFSDCKSVQLAIHNQILPAS